MIEGEDFCRGRPGDTIEGIAELYLGNPNLWPLLAQINKIPDTGIEEGMTLLLHPVGQEKEYTGKARKNFGRRKKYGNHN